MCNRGGDDPNSSKMDTWNCGEEQNPVMDWRHRVRGDKGQVYPSCKLSGRNEWVWVYSVNKIQPQLMYMMGGGLVDVLLLCFVLSVSKRQSSLSFHLFSHQRLWSLLHHVWEHLSDVSDSPVFLSFSSWFVWRSRKESQHGLHWREWWLLRDLIQLHTVMFL